MELKDLLNVIKKNGKVILVFSFLVGTLAVLISYFMPTAYRASATIYVKRQTEEESPDYFTYEGFYSQKTAQEYANTVVGFFNSNDIRREALESLSLPSGQGELGELDNKIVVKKVAPQLISLEVTEDTSEEASSVWEALAQTTIERVNLLNQTGDKDISIDVVNPEPLVELVEQNLWLNGVVAMLVGGFIGIFYISLKEYLNG